MTIIQRDKFQNVSQQRKSMISEEQKGKMSEAEQKQLHQMSDVQHELQKKQRQAAARRRRAAMWAKPSQYGEDLEQSQTFGRQKRRIKEDRVHQGEERHLYDGEVTEEKTSDEAIDHLLILACSAELMLDSENNFHTSHRSNWNDEGSDASPIAHKSQELGNATATDHKPPGIQLDEIHVNAHVNNGKDGSHRRGKTIRLTQIRRQARTKNQLIVQERIGEYTQGHFQGRTNRLSQIRHQARSKKQLLVQERIEKCTYRHLQGRITRLSQLRRRARSKNNLLVQEGIGECIHGRRLDCHTSEGNLSVEREAAEQGIVEECQKDCSSSEVESMHEDHIHEGASQSAIVNADVEDNMMCVKGRTRLTHLRREARLGNAYLVARIHAGSLDTEESIDVSLSSS